MTAKMRAKTTTEVRRRKPDTEPNRRVGEERDRERPAKCPACGKPVEPGWKACPVCGANVGPGATREV